MKCYLRTELLEQLVPHWPLLNVRKCEREPRELSNRFKKLNPEVSSGLNEKHTDDWNGWHYWNCWNCLNCLNCLSRLSCLCSRLSCLRSLGRTGRSGSR